MSATANAPPVRLRDRDHAAHMLTEIWVRIDRSAVKRPRGSDQLALAPRALSPSSSIKRFGHVLGF